MKKSNKKRRVRFLTLWAALIVIAASVFTGCPQKPKPKPTPKFEVNFSVEGANGTLKAQADGIAETETSSISVEEGKTVLFTATPASGYKVKSWTLDGNAVNGTNSTYSLKVTKAVTVKVSFEDDSTPLPQHAVTFGVEGANGTLSAEADGAPLTSGNTVQEGKTVLFTAAPNPGYEVKERRIIGAGMTFEAGTGTLQVKKSIIVHTLNSLKYSLSCRF